jgi:hypothetical protein
MQEREQDRCSIIRLDARKHLDNDTLAGWCTSLAGRMSERAALRRKVVSIPDTRGQVLPIGYMLLCPPQYVWVPVLSTLDSCAGRCGPGRKSRRLPEKYVNSVQRVGHVFPAARIPDPMTPPPPLEAAVQAAHARRRYFLDIR